MRVTVSVPSHHQKEIGTSLRRRTPEIPREGPQRSCRDGTNASNDIPSVPIRSMDGIFLGPSPEAEETHESFFHIQKRCQEHADGQAGLVSRVRQLVYGNGKPRQKTRRRKTVYKPMCMNNGRRKKENRWRASEPADRGRVLSRPSPGYHLDGPPVGLWASSAGEKAIAQERLGETSASVDRGGEEEETCGGPTKDATSFLLSNKGS